MYFLECSCSKDSHIPLPPFPLPPLHLLSLLSPLLSPPFYPPSHLPHMPSTYLVNFLLWNTLLAGYTISPCSNHPERYSMNNGGLVPSSSTSQQTQETIFYDTPIAKKQTVSTVLEIIHYVLSTLIVAT